MTLQVIITMCISLPFTNCNYINSSFLSYVYRFQLKLRDAKCRLPGVSIGLAEKKD